MISQSQSGPSSVLAAEEGRFPAALAAFDKANGEDPNHEIENGESVARELLYSRRMRVWLGRLYPDASEALQLAASCQHLERWVMPRKTYAAGRTGYLTWRRDLKRYHAERAGEILRTVGYPDDLIARVQSLVRKERLKRDQEVQALEDVVCLVFLAHYLAAFAEQHAEAKVVDILRKTWVKMSPLGRQAAFDLPPNARTQSLLATALTEKEPRPQSHLRS